MSSSTVECCATELADLNERRKEKKHCSITSISWMRIAEFEVNLRFLWTVRRTCPAICFIPKLNKWFIKKGRLKTEIILMLLANWRHIFPSLLGRHHRRKRRKRKGRRSDVRRRHPRTLCGCPSGLRRRFFCDFSYFSSRDCACTAWHSSSLLGGYFRWSQFFLHWK